MVIFGKLAKLLLCYKRYVLSHPGLHLPYSMLCHVAANGYYAVRPSQSK